MKEEIFNYMKKLDRKDFIDSHAKGLASFDMALPIGYGQTISQPTLVLEMSNLLELNDKCKVLEIGTGSGYQTAILAHFANEVYTVELIEELSLKAKKRLEKLGYKNISYFIQDGSLGLEKYAPYDRIIVTAASREIPPQMIEQLKPGGILIIPVGDKYMQQLKKIKKDKTGQISEENIEAVMFVELKGKYGWK